MLVNDCVSDWSHMQMVLSTCGCVHEIEDNIFLLFLLFGI